jgi:hypothetical protein
MKKLRLLVLISVLSFVANQLSAQFNEPVSAIGKQITKETAFSWLKNFDAKRPDAVKGNFYGVKALQQLMSNGDVAGVIIFNGRDDEGKSHIIFKACDESAEVLPNVAAYDNSSPCPPVCPKPGTSISDIGGVVDAGLADQWIDNFKTNYDGHVVSHLFGTDIFEQLMGQKGVQGIYLANGLDDQGNEHVVLAGVNKEGGILWNGLVANNSSPCPPVCPKPKIVAKK